MTMEEGRVVNVEEYTQDGTVNLKGKPVLRSKSGGWKACSFVVVYEIFERMAYYGISSNLILYLTKKLHQGTVTASNNVTNWVGTIWITPILGAYVADAHLGRYWTFVIASTVYLSGMSLLTLSLTHKHTPMAQEQQDSPFGLLAVDDFYFSALFDDVDEAGLDAISDDKYANELQFQETLMASVITSQNASSSSSIPTPPPLSSFPCVASSSKAVDVSLVVPKIELVGEEEAIESLLIICEICVEPKESEEMFRSQRCDHSFCSECVTKHVATKIQESITVVSCPGLNCEGVLELDACRPMLPNDLIERWDDALCEALFLSAPKFYCPFRDCSAMMLLDEDEGEGGEEIRESECPFCHRLFCARCHVPWHPGVRCEEFQTLNEDERGREDLLVRELANSKKWSRCPKCKFYVEKAEGCLHITCRCRFEFCYACGNQWTSSHGGCQRN